MNPAAPFIATASSRDRLLEFLKTGGAAPVSTLARHLDITTMAVRQHLAGLEDEGLIEAEQLPAAGRGRPGKAWKLTRAGHGRFPDAHAQVTAELIISVRDVLGETVLDQLIDHRTQATREVYALHLERCTTLEEKLERLVALRTDEGYMAECHEHEGGYRLVEHHCPICTAAESCQGFCRSELDTFRELLVDLATVDRVSHLLTGGERCSYQITPV